MPKKVLISLFFLICLALSFVHPANAIIVESVEFEKINGISNRNPAVVTVNNTDNQIQDYIVYAYVTSISTSKVEWKLEIYDRNATNIDVETVSRSLTTYAYEHRWFFCIVENAEPETSLKGFWVISAGNTRTQGVNEYRLYVDVYFYNWTSQSLTTLVGSTWTYTSYSTGYHGNSEMLFSNTIFLGGYHYVAFYSISLYYSNKYWDRLTV